MALSFPLNVEDKDIRGLAAHRSAEGSPVGNLLFAGDHCDLEFQGYMNGAAYTGRLAAKEILSRV